MFGIFHFSITTDRTTLYVYILFVNNSVFFKDMNDINDVYLHSKIEYSSINPYSSSEDMDVDIIVDYTDCKKWHNITST